MDKPVLRLGFTDYFKGIDDFFVHWLSFKYDIVRDDKNPDFLIFCDETFGQVNRAFDNTNVVKIFFTGENRRHWNYNCHYAITFDHYDTPSHYRLPLYVVDHWLMVDKLRMDSIITRQEMREKMTWVYDRKFCCFISGNPGNEHRNKFFHLLNEYKRVDSYGPLYNNMGAVLPRGDEAAKSKDSVMQDYKFNLCFENGDFPGYCTEKLMHAFYSQTVPIYAGSSTAGGIDFNPKAFLNWHDYLDDNAFMDAIIALDNDDICYDNMFHQSFFCNDEKNKFFDCYRFVDWFHNNIYSKRKQ